MRILQVDLDNVKSYRHARVPFTPGTNAICGHNGAGKSTLLEAIGFALFDFLAVKQDDFVREGEKTATVTVHVTDADGRVYHVVRRCGGSSQYYVYDPELDRRLTEGKAETALWLREFLGVEPAADLPVLFRDAVGVPQGLLTAAFLETAGRRKDVFNPLLRVDEYERVWDALRVPRRQLERQIAGEEKRIAGLTAEVKGLPDLRAQLADLTAHIAQSMQRQSDLQVTLEDVVARKTRLEALKNQLDALDKHVAQAEAALQTLAARHRSRYFATGLSWDNACGSGTLPRRNNINQQSQHDESDTETGSNLSEKTGGTATSEYRTTAERTTECTCESAAASGLKQNRDYKSDSNQDMQYY